MRIKFETLDVRNPDTNEAMRVNVERNGDCIIERIQCANKDEAETAIALVQAEVSGFDASVRAWNIGFGNSRVRIDRIIEEPSTIEICGRISGLSDKPGPLLVEKFVAVRRALLFTLGRS